MGSALTCRPHRVPAVCDDARFRDLLLDRSRPFLSKPFTAAGLVATVRTMLGP